MNNVTSSDAIKMLKSNDSILVDVRTSAEWELGSPSSMNEIDVVFLSLFNSPDMSPNLHFAEDFVALGIEKNKKLFFLCRSGVRSGAAAEICASLGYNCYNIVDGFVSYQKLQQDLP